jgi:hypothetical protein
MVLNRIVRLRRVVRLGCALSPILLLAERAPRADAALQKLAGYEKGANTRSSRCTRTWPICATRSCRWRCRWARSGWHVHVRLAGRGAHAVRRGIGLGLVLLARSIIA